MPWRFQLVIARQGRMSAGPGRQVRGRRGDCLNAGLLIVGDDRHRIARLLFRGGLLDELHFSIDTQEPPPSSAGTPNRGERTLCGFTSCSLRDLAHGALSQLGKAGVSLRRFMLTRMGEQPRRPQFVGIAEFLGLRQARSTTHALGSAVIVASLPGRRLASDTRQLRRQSLQSRRRVRIFHIRGPRSAGPLQQARPRLCPCARQDRYCDRFVQDPSPMHEARRRKPRAQPR